MMTVCMSCISSHFQTDETRAVVFALFPTSSSCARDGTLLVLRPSRATCSSKEFETKTVAVKYIGGRKLSLDKSNMLISSVRARVHTRHLAPEMHARCC